MDGFTAVAEKDSRTGAAARDYGEASLVKMSVMLFSPKAPASETAL